MRGPQPRPSRVTQLRTNAGEPVLAGTSPVTIELHRAIERSRGARSVVVRGPAGSGRRGVARALHNAAGADDPRGGDAPYVEARCPGLSGSWGVERLLGTSERPGLLAAAAGGTLALVGVEELDLDQQELLADALATSTFTPLGARAPRPVDLRLVAITCDEDLERVLASEELAYRLNEHQIVVPPLATRGTDLVAIAGALLARREKAAVLDPTARDRIAATAFIGGVDEFEQWLDQALERAPGGRIGAEHLDGDPALCVDRPGAALRSVAPGRADTEVLPLGDRSWRGVERALIERVLEESDGNRSRAARVLGFNRSTLYNKLRQYGIE